jgi:alpha/beta superfamily hydrolase
VAKTNELPPPPEHPLTSPPVLLTGESQVMIEGLLGEPSVEARVRGSEDATRAVLLCHPHPLYGGTMHSAVVVALGKVLAEAGEGLATVRFNYRGVGKSGGAYAEGLGETKDARAALRIFQFVREDASTFQGRIAVYLGDQDEFCDVAEAEALAKDLGARLTVFPGNDHYFLAGRRKLAEAVVPFLRAMG